MLLIREAIGMKLLYIATDKRENKQNLMDVLDIVYLNFCVLCHCINLLSMKGLKQVICNFL